MSAEQKIVKCNKCQKEGLHWGTKQVKDKTYNILLEVDGSEHRPYKDGKAECKKDTPKNLAPTQSTLTLTEDQATQLIQNVGALKNVVEELKTIVLQIKSRAFPEE